MSTFSNLCQPFLTPSFFSQVGKLPVTVMQSLSRSKPFQEKKIVYFFMNYTKTPVDCLRASVPSILSSKRSRDCWFSHHGAKRLVRAVHRRFRHNHLSAAKPAQN
jgi:hypothetical protein